MQPTLVTGANGHVGYNVCRALVTRGEPVRGMIRPTANAAPLEELGVDLAYGDILDPAACEAAVAGCGRAIHTAAGFLMWSPNPERDIIAASLDGTRNVLAAAAAAGVDRVVYVSTGGTIGFSDTPSRVLDESHVNETPHVPYFVGKIAAEREAFAIAERTGMDVVAINPGFILGPRFWKPSESVRQVADFVAQGMPIYFDGGFGVVDVEDVASGALLAMERGRDRERYVVSGDNVTVKQVFDWTAAAAGIAPPWIRMPRPVLRVLAGGMELAGRLGGSRPILDRAQVDEFAGVYGYLSAAKAERDLGWTYRPARDAVRRTVAWLLDHGFVDEKRRAALSPDAGLAGVY